jgi:6-pyruvoyltetrahydropterin/6-carboxytetrahydropterin synthase
MAVIRITRQFHFEMAHALLNYDGRCSNIHGHSYILRVTLTGEINISPGSPSDGMVMDFGDIKTIVKNHIIDAFDHSLMINNLIPEDQVEPLRKTTKRIHLVNFQPTTENIVIYVATKLRKHLPPCVSLFSVRLCETPNSYAEWFASDNP